MFFLAPGAALVAHHFFGGIGAVGDGLVAALDALLQLGGDDAQRGDGLADPFALGALPAHPVAGVGIFEPLRLVPDQAAEVEGVAQDAGALSGMAVDGGGDPGGLAGAVTRPGWGDAAGVEVGGNPAGGLAGGEALPDLAHDLGLVGLDDELGALLPTDTAITVGQTAGVEAAFGLAFLAAMGAKGQVLQVERGQQGAHPALGGAAGAAGVVAVRDSDDAHAAMFQAAHRLDAFDLVTAEPGQVLHQQDRPQARGGIRQQVAIAGPVQPAARDGSVGIDLIDYPALGRGPAPADCLLVG